MGVNTDGQICYGILLEEGAELPWDNEDECDHFDNWWIKETGFKPSFMPFNKLGDYKVGVKSGDERIDKYFEEIRQWQEKNPPCVVPVNCCSASAPIWILAIPQTLTTASRGYPESLNVSGMHNIYHDHKSRMQYDKPLIEFAQKYKLEVRDWTPKWWLSSYWSE